MSRRLHTTVLTAAALFALACLGVLRAHEQAGTAEAPISAKQVMALVHVTGNALEKDVPGTIAAICEGLPPYVDKLNAALYVFVYNEQLTIVAHPNAKLVGKNLEGRTDARGTKFRDRIMTLALTRALLL